MKKTLTVPKMNKSNLSITISENLNKFKSKLENLKAYFKKNKLDMRDHYKGKVKKNNYVPFSNEIAFKIGEMGFDKYGNLVTW
jgi:hypothetical protein